MPEYEIKTKSAKKKKYNKISTTKTLRAFIICICLQAYVCAFICKNVCKHIHESVEISALQYFFSLSVVVVVVVALKENKFSQQFIRIVCMYVCVCVRTVGAYLFGFLFTLLNIVVLVDYC